MAEIEAMFGRLRGALQALDAGAPVSGVGAVG
jgi:hypothetical protein